MSKVGEVKLTCFSAEHIFLFNFVSFCTNLVRSVYPDSKIVENWAMGRTRVCAIVINVIGKTNDWRNLGGDKNNHFTLLVDER